MSDSDKPAASSTAVRSSRVKKRKYTEPVPFGPYRLLNLLGQGGMGRVYRAVRYGPQGAEEELALKILDRRATSTSSQVRALVDEVRLGQLLRHPNIVRTDELRKVGDSYCIAMELVDGWPLDRLVELHKKQDQPIPLVTALELMLSISEGLTYAHGLRDEEDQHLGLVHRDLKPGNVMVARSGGVKLMDFGTAKSASNLYQTEDGETRGTPLYMSPEQVMGYELDQRSDIFSLGSILYELVMLEPCFRGNNLVMVMRNVADAELDEQREDIATAAAALEPIFSRCMEREASNRFPTVPELADKLRELVENRPPGPSIGDWLDRLRGQTPDSRTGDFGSVAVPGNTADLPTVNIESLDTDELKVARAGFEDKDLQELKKTLDPESAKTQMLGEPLQPQGALPQASMPVAPETADILKTDETPSVPEDEEFRPAQEAPKDTASNSVEPPPGTTTPRFVSKSPDGSLKAEGAVRRKRRDHPPEPPALLDMKRTGVARFWMRQLFRVTIVAALCLAFLPMLPQETRNQIKERANAIVEMLGVSLNGSEEPGDNTRGWARSPFLDKAVHVDAGELRLGAPKPPDGAQRPAAIPVPPFNIMAYEVTVGDFQNWCRGEGKGEACSGWKGAEKWQNAKHPVVGITWTEASAFCTSWDGRLPTESEWELAARGPEGRTYPWGNEWAAGHANYCDLGCDSPYLPSTYEDDGTPQTAPVDSFAEGATSDGIRNLAGNVSEWTLDCWSSDHSNRKDWRSSSRACDLRIIRGGSWKQPVSSLAGWHRSSMRGDARAAQVGFRCVRGRDPF